LTAASSGAESVLRLGLEGWIGFLAAGRNAVCVDLDDRIADRLPVLAAAHGLEPAVASSLSRICPVSPGQWRTRHIRRWAT
jgi:hypothetical protein